jgi:hypothetical protein
MRELIKEELQKLKEVVDDKIFNFLKKRYIGKVYKHNNIEVKIIDVRHNEDSQLSRPILIIIKDNEDDVALPNDIFQMDRYEHILKPIIHEMKNIFYVDVIFRK